MAIPIKGKEDLQELQVLIYSCLSSFVLLGVILCLIWRCDITVLIYYIIKIDPDAEVVSLSPKTLLESDRYVCEICNQGFQRDQNLQMHRRRHKVPWKLLKRETPVVKKRVFVCPEPSCLHHDPCHALGDLVGIKKHFRRKHSNHKQWVCDKCSKGYAVQSDYKAHLKTCGTRGHSCDCGRVFSRFLFISSIVFQLIYNYTHIKVLFIYYLYIYIGWDISWLISYGKFKNASSYLFKLNWSPCLPKLFLLIGFDFEKVKKHKKGFWSSLTDGTWRNLDQVVNYCFRFNTFPEDEHHLLYAMWRDVLLRFFCFFLVFLASQDVKRLLLTPKYYYV